MLHKLVIVCCVLLWSCGMYDSSYSTVLLIVFSVRYCHCVIADTLVIPKHTLNCQSVYSSDILARFYVAAAPQKSVLQLKGGTL